MRERECVFVREKALEVASPVALEDGSNKVVDFEPFCDWYIKIRICQLHKGSKSRSSFELPPRAGGLPRVYFQL